MLVIIPFLTSYLIRMYAWQFILQRDGLLNSLLGAIGLGSDHVFLNTSFAVILGLTYGFLPFMILPLYASIERMDPSLVEASYDLGHGKVVHAVSRDHPHRHARARRGRAAGVHPRGRRLRDAPAPRRRARRR